jgi:hypothetical protein
MLDLCRPSRGRQLFVRSKRFRLAPYALCGLTTHSDGRRTGGGPCARSYTCTIVRALPVAAAPASTASSTASLMSSSTPSGRDLISTSMPAGWITEWHVSVPGRSGGSRWWRGSSPARVGNELRSSSLRLSPRVGALGGRAAAWSRCSSVRQPRAHLVLIRHGMAARRRSESFGSRTRPRQTARHLHLSRTGRL